jgi:hypothetical protein
MEIGAALAMFAVGAILTFAVNVHTQVLNLHIVGVILMIISAVGSYLSRRGNTWVHKVIVGRPGRRLRRPATLEEIDEAIYPPYVKENPHAIPGAVVEPVIEPGDTTVAKLVAERLAEGGE